MPDMRDAFRNAGFRNVPTERGRRGGPRAGVTETRTTIGNDCFPHGYPRYLTDDGHTRVELVQGEAEKIAECFRSAGLNRHQLRAFYNHAKRQLQRLDYGTPFVETRVEIARLQYFAADRAARSNNPVPAVFKNFIERNIVAVRDEVTFRKGFMPHFEAVVAYCANLRER